MSDIFYTNFALRHNDVLLSLYKHGKKEHVAIPYKPSLFIPTDEPTEYFDHLGFPVRKITFSNIRTAKDFVLAIEEKQKSGEYDLVPPEVYGFQRYDAACVADLFKSDLDVDLNQIKTMYFDIETSTDFGFPDVETAMERITSICCLIRDQFYVLGMKDYTPKTSNVRYVRCFTEAELLQSFINYIIKEDPDILIGYNSEQFDIPYLVKRIERILGDGKSKELSPWKQIQSRKMFVNGYQYTAYDFVGRQCLDYLTLYQKFIPGKPENYKLDTITSSELGEGKIKFECSFSELYENHFEKFIDYNIQDVLLLTKLEEKLNLVRMVLTIAYIAKINYSDVFKQVRIWDALIFNEFKKHKIVMPPSRDSNKEVQFAGADVKPPLVGMHKDVVSFDVNSLYPMIMTQYNISPETLQQDIHVPTTVQKILDREIDFSPEKTTYSFTANGVCFAKQKQGFLPMIIERMYSDRKKYKKLKVTKDKELQEINRVIEMRKCNGSKEENPKTKNYDKEETNQGQI
jgi:DNA polymerase elongation subunit (family B)